MKQDGTKSWGGSRGKGEAARGGGGERYHKSRKHPRVCFAEFPGSLRYTQTGTRRKGQASLPGCGAHSSA